MLNIYNINNLRLLFRDKLSGIYEQNEIDSIFSLVIEHVLNFNRTYQLLNNTKTIASDKADTILIALKHLEQKKPVQYIIGNTEFYDLKFLVDQNVLIPRQETELLVDLIIKQNAKKYLSILDIGTGSGCIAICLKKHLPNAKITAIDISEEALTIAKINAKINKTDIDFLNSNILDNDLLLGKYDIIVSNPPYVKEDEKEYMHDNVLNFEPHLALFVPNSRALKFYIAISDFAKSNLKDKGSIWVEINEALGKETSEIFNNNGFADTNIIKDLNNKDRFILASK